MILSPDYSPCSPPHRLSGWPLSNRWFLGAHAAIGALLVNPLFPGEGGRGQRGSVKTSRSCSRVRLIRDGVVSARSAPVTRGGHWAGCYRRLEIAGVGEEPGVGRPWRSWRSVITVGMPVGIGIAVTSFGCMRSTGSSPDGFLRRGGRIAGCTLRLAALVRSQTSDKPLSWRSALGAAALLILRQRTRVGRPPVQPSLFDAERVMSVSPGRCVMYGILERGGRLGGRRQRDDAALDGGRGENASRYRMGGRISQRSRSPRARPGHEDTNTGCPYSASVHEPDRLSLRTAWLGWWVVGLVLVIQMVTTAAHGRWPKLCLDRSLE
jgi:hypothetical protein